jgi:hypothetical protein
MEASDSDEWCEDEFVEPEPLPLARPPTKSQWQAAVKRAGGLSTVMSKFDGYREVDDELSPQHLAL